MPIFESKALTVAFVASSLSFVPYYLVLCREGLRIAERRHVRVFFAIWLAAFTFEFYFLGPYSFVEQTTEGNLNVTVNYYLTHGYDGGTFTHRYAGGQDLYTLLFGKHFFNPERTLIAIFPLWIAILLHKLFIAAVGFAGAYLLARRLAPANRAAAVAVGAIFPVSHLYLLNFSTNWSPGFSVLPLVVYLCVTCSGEARYWRRVLLAAVVLTPADPIHVFPALTAAVIGTVFLFDTVDVKRVALSFLFLVLCSLANWHEVLYAFYQNVGLTSRVEGLSGFDLEFLEAIWFALSYAGSRLKIPGVLLLLSVLVLAVGRDPYLKRALVATAIWLISFALAEALPWQWLGLGALEQLSHYYMLLSLLVIFLPITARALAAPKFGTSVIGRWQPRLKPEVALLAAALAVLTWDKAVNFANFAWFGGQANLFAYETLQDNSWKPDEAFRVVTLLETPNSNIVAGMYGLDTYDGQLNMNHAAWQDYWFSIVRRDPTHMLTTRAGVKWKYWNGSTYAVDDHLRIDLLGIANVRFLLSGLPLEGSGLRPIVVPSAGNQAKMAWPKSAHDRVDFFEFRLRRIFDPGEHYVYELPQFLPRVFAATDVETVATGTNGPQLHERVAAVAPNRVIVVSESDASIFQGFGILKTVTNKKVTDGFDITVEAPEGGIVVVNTMYVPYWKAETRDGQSLDIAQANAVQIAIAVPPGTKNIKVRYRRPTLRKKIGQLLN